MASWRQLEEWATALKTKWKEPFFKSELTIIFLQIIFAVVLLAFAYGFFSYFYEGILRTVITGVRESVLSGSFNNGENLTNSLQIIKAKNFVLFASILSILVTIFTFLITKMTLSPTRNTLESQKRFISDIAHELRTPLAIIKTSNEVALMDADLEPKMKDMIHGNIEELNRMSEIINNILSFNSMLRPERVKFESVNLGPVIDMVVQKLIVLAEKKHLDITVKKVAPHVVWGNSVALEQIITNLLKNAINYTPQGGHITIRVGPDYYGNILIHIEDTGIGVTKKDLMHIFEPFFRAERSRNRSNGSSGLGLTITRELVKIHSGRITIKSVENEGTTAIVTLPYSKAAEDSDQVDIADLNEVSINFLRPGKKTE